MDEVIVRPARPADLPALVEIELAAGELFRPLGMHLVADDDPGTVEELSRYQRDGRAWVAAGPDDLPVGYLLADVVDGEGHVEQVSVHPAHGRRGIGRSLIAAAGAWAAARGLPALTLTTYADVPWNGPYYARLGFRPLAGHELGPGLAALRAREAAHGLDRWPRLAMRRTVAAVLTETDLSHLRRCAELAEEAVDAGDEPFGSLLVDAAGAVLFEDRNRTAAGDQTRHPEFAIARWAAENLAPGERGGATVYTSGEHCAMCSAAHGWVGLGRIVYAASSEQLAGWSRELGLPPGPVAVLPIRAVVPGAAVDGPAPSLAHRIRELHARFHRG